MNDFQTRLDALSPDKRAVFERLLQQRAPGRGAASGAGFAPAVARPDAPAPYEAPRTPIEKILVSTWEEVLAVPRVGIHDNFFELGGDSIHCIQIVARARRAGLESVQPADLRVPDGREPGTARVAKSRGRR